MTFYTTTSNKQRNLSNSPIQLLGVRQNCIEAEAARVFLMTDRVFLMTDRVFLMADRVFLMADRVFLMADRVFLMADRVFLIGG